MFGVLKLRRYPVLEARCFAVLFQCLVTNHRHSGTLRASLARTIWPHNRVPKSDVEGPPFRKQKENPAAVKGLLCNFPGLLTGPQKQKCGIRAHTGRFTLAAAPGSCRFLQIVSPRPIPSYSGPTLSPGQEGTQGQAGTEGRLGWPRVTYTSGALPPPLPAHHKPGYCSQDKHGASRLMP